jgi:hypothetical protein
MVGLFSGEKGLWNVAEEALLLRKAMRGKSFSGLRVDSYFDGFA